MDAQDEPTILNPRIVVTGREIDQAQGNNWFKSKIFVLYIIFLNLFSTRYMVDVGDIRDTELPMYRMNMDIVYSTACVDPLFTSTLIVNSKAKLIILLLDMVKSFKQKFHYDWFDINVVESIEVNLSFSGSSKTLKFIILNDGQIELYAQDLQRGLV